MFCFFFKQKTAYEVRISDWSSDVCSSDLSSLTLRKYWVPASSPPRTISSASLTVIARTVSAKMSAAAGTACSAARFIEVSKASTEAPAPHRRRSEEHTSELQSLMRTSYAVFCLKKKTHQHHKQQQQNTVECTQHTIDTRHPP